MKCQAQQHSDRMRCAPCDQSWDVNDPAPPPCKEQALRALGESAIRNAHVYQQQIVNPGLLERIPNPADNFHTAMWEHIHVPEFTCLCPVTGQPDFATIEIYFCPIEWCVESKSLKLYMGSYRNVGMFHEVVCTKIVNDLNALLDTRWILVTGLFAARGGIPFRPRVWMGNPPSELLYRVGA